MNYSDLCKNLINKSNTFSRQNIFYIIDDYSSDKNNSNLVTIS